jgi:phage N-6-adenine-methyltransferase
VNREAFSRTEETKDRWETPPYFFKLLNENINFTLDPCASDQNHLCDKYYTIEDNGLKQDWRGENVFVNPPYSYITEWVKKCYEEGKKAQTNIILLIPSRTDTRYWHNYIMKANEILFCKGRIRFLLDGKIPMKKDKNGKLRKTGSTFPSAVILFNRMHLGYPSIKTLEHKHLEVRK